MKKLKAVKSFSFALDRRNALYKIMNLDKSKKGSIDTCLRDIINIINSKKNYFTTSSCSGRIYVYNLKTIFAKKHEFDVIYTTHEKAKVSDVLKELEKPENKKKELWLKMESFILHIACKTLFDALALLKLANSLGLKHSGIMGISRTKGNTLADADQSPEKIKKIMVEIRGNYYINAPVKSDEYSLANLIDDANNLLDLNLEILKKLELKLKELG